MAGSETSKNLLEQARVSQGALGLQKERKIAMTSTALTVRNTLGSVHLRCSAAMGVWESLWLRGSRDGGRQEVRIDGIGAGIRIRKNQKCKKRLLSGLHT
jgi:hypothetical protein